MELPKKLIDQVKKDEAREEKIRSKIMATQQYRRRKLDKDVRRYTKHTNPIRFRAIESIGDRHKFFVGETLFREDTPSRKDA